MSSQFFRPASAPEPNSRPEAVAELPNPFKRPAPSADYTSQISQIRQQVNALAALVDDIGEIQQTIAANAQDTADTGTQNATSPPPTEESNKDYLVAVGLPPDEAEAILRRISEQQFKSLELRNLIRRGPSADRQQNRDELRDLSNNRISLRSELDDFTYDQYLFASGQNNRVKVASVMAGSPAEFNGVEQGDVILYYDDKKIVSTSDLQQSAQGTDTGDHATVEILRDGNRMSLTLPRGVMGVRLDAIQLEPAQ